MMKKTKANEFPLKEMSIDDVFNGDKATYEVPIYQRNYAWEKDEIQALIQDVYDASNALKKTYYIGTLVSHYDKNKNVFEVIDGQQRLTTIYLILCALRIPPKNKLTYRSRKKSNDALEKIWEASSKDSANGERTFAASDKDAGIEKGLGYVKKALNDTLSDNSISKEEQQEKFTEYLLNNVHLIHYQVPKDVDLNHYFEVMNSRGEQLEKQEIIKARLIGVDGLTEIEKSVFNRLWEYCSDMGVYIQQKYDNKTAAKIFGNNLDGFAISSFDDLLEVGGSDGDNSSKKTKNDDIGKKTINELIGEKLSDNPQVKESEKDNFQPIIDFANFLLIVLKITRMEENAFAPTEFTLDDKELIKEFDKLTAIDIKFVKTFAFNLLKAKYLLDNYIVHHSKEEESEKDTSNKNPWELKHWCGEGYSKNLDSDRESEEQPKLLQLLSMFEVSFTARQRKNYLFYCLLYLFRNEDRDVGRYYSFVSKLADKFFKDVYMKDSNLNEINTPKPGSFDDEILAENEININSTNDNFAISRIFGACDKKESSKGIPLFVFNYLDYKLWEKYFDKFRIVGANDESGKQENFFAELGCSDFGLKVFKGFYFSRTRGSLEHFYAQALVKRDETILTEEQINCFGNYAMIGGEANSSGSNWSPKTKLAHYLDDSGKIKRVGVASLKFMIMMQMCKDNTALNSRELGQEWNLDDIKEHQNKMLRILQVL
jgi:uncharacterized protein with ParB-like and HNH nuclease domain